LNQITNKGAFASRKVLYHETWWQALLLPVRFFIEGQDDNPQYFDGKLTPFLLVLPILAFLLKPSSLQEGREKKILLAFALLYFFSPSSKRHCASVTSSPLSHPWLFCRCMGYGD